jgi:predicted Zn-dependent peptidase
MILYEPAGVFIMYAITDVTRLIKDGSNPGVLPILFGIIDDLIKHGVKDAELKQTKTRIREQLKMASVAGDERAGYNGIRVMLHNETKILANPELYEECYKSITKTDVNAMINKYFTPRQLYFSVVGGKLPKKSELIRVLKTPILNTK